MRLGGGFSFAEAFPDKPPGMRWRTYPRMQAAAGARRRWQAPTTSKREREQP